VKIKKPDTLEGGIMGTAENKQLLQGIFAELAKGNFQPFVDAMADDLRWMAMGQKNWSRTFEGKQAVLTDLFGLLQSRIEGNIRTTAQRFIADGDYVVVEARGHSTTKTGKAYNNAYCFVFRLGGGKLKEVSEYMDTELATAVFGNGG
jgi:uncharacterized protein